MNAERLTILRDFLRNMTPLQREHFDMSAWIGHGKDEDGDPLGEYLGFRGAHIGRDMDRFSVAAVRLLFYNNETVYEGVVSEADLLTCGTSACALGWAAALFAKEGLRIGGKLGMWLTVMYDGEAMSDAGAKFFDIRSSAAEYLFVENLDLKPEQVADRIDKLLANPARTGSWEPRP